VIRGSCSNLNRSACPPASRIRLLDLALSVDCHGSELVDDERASTHADSLLAEDDRPAVADFDGHGYCCHDGGEEDQRH
jgi:hypothetical protein